MVEVAEAVGGDDDVGLGGPEDVLDLLGAVEVHDRHDHGAEVGGGPERDAGLDPVRELEHDEVAGPTPRARSSAASERAARSTSAKVPDHGRTFDRTWNARGPCPRPVGDHRPEGGVGPPALGPVALGEVARQRASAQSADRSPSRRSCAMLRGPVHAAAIAIVAFGELGLS